MTSNRFVRSQEFYIFWGSKFNHAKSLDTLFTTLISISSIMMGFMLTSKPIPFSIQDNDAVRRFKSSNDYQCLIRYILDSIHSCLLLAVYSGFCLFYGVTIDNTYFMTLLIFAISYAALSFYRSSQIFYIFLEISIQSNSGWHQRNKGPT